MRGLQRAVGKYFSIAGHVRERDRFVRAEKGYFVNAYHGAAAYGVHADLFFSALDRKSVV